MSIQALTWAYQQRELKPLVKFLLVTLAGYADDLGTCFPGIDTLVADTSMHRATVIRNIQELEKSGHLARVVRPGDGAGRRSNSYQLNWCAEEQKTGSNGQKSGSNGQKSPHLTQSANPTHCPGNVAQRDIGGGKVAQSDIATGKVAERDIASESGYRPRKPGKVAESDIGGQSRTVRPYPKDKNKNIKNSCPEKNTTPPEKQTVDPQDLETATWMWALIETLAPGQKKPRLSTWAKTIGEMRTRDHRSLDDIKTIFLWAHNDKFWRMNVRSPEKLRLKFDDLNVRRIQGEKNSRPGGKGQKFDHGAYYEQKARELAEKETPPWA